MSQVRMKNVYFSAFVLLDQFFEFLIEFVTSWFTFFVIFFVGRWMQL